MTHPKPRPLIDARRASTPATITTITVPIVSADLAVRPGTVAALRTIRADVLARPAARARRLLAPVVATAAVGTFAALGVAGYLLGQAKAGLGLLASAGVVALVLTILALLGRRASSAAKHCPGCPE